MRQAGKSVVRGALKSLPYPQKRWLAEKVFRFQSPRQSQSHPPRQVHRRPRRPPVGQRIAPARQKAGRQPSLAVNLPQVLRVPPEVRQAVLQLDQDQSPLPQTLGLVLRQNLRRERSAKSLLNTTAITNQALSPVALIHGVPFRRGRSQIHTRRRHTAHRQVVVKNRQAAAA